MESGDLREEKHVVTLLESVVPAPGFYPMEYPGFNRYSTVT